MSVLVTRTWRDTIGTAAFVLKEAIRELSTMRRIT